MTSHCNKLSIMTLLIMNSCAPATAFMRGSARGHSSKQEEDAGFLNIAKSRLDLVAAAGQKRHLLSEKEDADTRMLIHDTKLLTGSVLMRAAVASGLFVGV
jgi:hypothetical protein